MKSKNSLNITIPPPSVLGFKTSDDEGNPFNKRSKSIMNPNIKSEDGSEEKNTAIVEKPLQIPHII